MASRSVPMSARAARPPTAKSRLSSLTSRPTRGGPVRHLHQRAVSVMAMRKLHLDRPPTVHSPAHRIRERIPAVEISDKTDGLRCASQAIEVHRLGCILGSVPVISGG